MPAYSYPDVSEDNVNKLNKELIIPNSQKHLPEADDFIESNLTEAGFEESIVYDIAISTTELINNAILHGNKGDSTREVKIRLSIDDEKIEVDVIDQGSGFDLTSIPDPLAEENLLKEVGRGIFIARSLMDKLDFGSEPGWGTKATLTKYLTKITSSK